MDDLTRFALPLSAGPHFLIAGGPRSGKSTLLCTWAHSLLVNGSPAGSAGAGGSVPPRLFVLDSRRQGLGGLRSLPHVAGYSSEPAAAEKLLAQIEEELSRLALDGAGGDANPAANLAANPALVVMADDFGDNYDDGLGDGGRERLVALMRLGRNQPFHVLLAGRASDLSSKSYLDPVKSLKEAQVGFMLGSGDDVIFNTRLPYTERSKMLPVGEGYYINRTYVRRIKVAVLDAAVQGERV